MNTNTSDGRLRVGGGKADPKSEISNHTSAHGRRLGVRELIRMRNQFFALERRLKEAAMFDGALASVHTQVDKLSREVWALAEKRQIAEARRKDRGEVLWTICLPRSSWMDRPGSVVRTPHLTIRDHGFFTVNEPSVHVHDHAPINRPWQDLADELERARREFTIEKIEERAKLVDGKPRGFFAREFGELERELAERQVAA